MLKSFLHRVWHRRSYSFFILEKNSDFSAFVLERQILEIGEADFNKSSVFNLNDRRYKFIQRLQNGHKCYAYKDVNGEVISYYWVSENMSVPFTFGVNMDLPEGTVYIWDCRTSDDYQGQGLYTEGLCALAQIYQNHNITINCETSNIPSYKGIKKTGFVYCGSINALLLCRKYVLIWGQHIIARLYKNPKLIHIEIAQVKEKK